MMAPSTIKVICLVLLVECLISVKSEIRAQQELSNSTGVNDRQDVGWKKPPRKRGTFGLGHSLYTSASFKGYPHLKKDFIEKYVPVPVHVKVPIHIPKLYPVPVEKPVPVPIKVNVPQPFPVYKKIAVPVKVPVDRPVPIQILKPYPVLVEKQVPYPVDKPVPIPVKVPVDRPYPVYVAFEKPTEKPSTMNLMQLKWQPESGKMMSWMEKPDMSTSIRMNGEEIDNEKLIQSFLEIPEQSESDIVWPAGAAAAAENIELEIRK